VGAFAAIESGDASQMVDSSSEALLEEIHKKHRRISLWRGVAVLCSFVVCAAWLNDAALWAIGLAAAAGVAVTTLAFRWDVQRKLTILHYDLTPQAMEAFGRLMDAGTHLNQCNRVWHLKGQAAILDRKYHAGASAAVARAAASVGTKMPPFMACNVDPIAVVLTKLTLYFFPDRVLVYQGSRVGAVAYGALDCHVDETRFVEEEPPGDAEVVGRTWRFVNKSGGPDRRFHNNRELPICRYGQIIFKSGSGLNEILQLSGVRATADFVPALRGVAQITL
jgi:hypothetical protein